MEKKLLDKYPAQVMPMPKRSAQKDFTGDISKQRDKVPSVKPPKAHKK